MLVGVVGAGAMGGGIARVSAQSGADVLLYDVRDGAADQAVEAMRRSLDRQVQKGRLSEAGFSAILSNVRTVDSLDALGGCDLVIEAVVENLDIKRQVFADLESVVSPDCILATNTSSLSIGSIFRTLKTPERTIGLHFFNPVHVMKLVEVVPGPFTTTATRKTAQSFVERLGKTGVVAQDSPGFVVNMAGRAYATEALAIIQDGVATPEQVDRIMVEGLKFPLGPFELMDMTGIDVNYPVSQNIHEHSFADPMLRSTWLHRYLYETGLHGQKAGKGFYDYEPSTSGPSRISADSGIEPATGSQAPKVVILEADPTLEDFCRKMGLEVSADDDGASPILCAPVGGDCTEYAVRCSVDPVRVIGVDLALGIEDIVTLMARPGTDPAIVDPIAAWIARTTPVEIIRDSAGFVAQRMIAAIVNLGCGMAQHGVAAPRDIDTAVELGLRYPAGPLALADRYGPALIQRILTQLHQIFQDDRYRTSQWLRRRALSGASIYQPEFSR